MAIMLGLSIFVLIGFLALVIDLGRTYVVRTELQNAADAAALAGAKQLNQTAAGVCCGPDSAVSHAIAMAAQNNFKFSTPVTITSANIWVGSCPDDVPTCPMVLASSITTDALAAGKTFLKVHIPSGSLSTFFAVVPTTAAGTGTPSTSTFGSAVAGHFVTQIMPIGVCAIDLIKGGRLPHAGLPDELTEFGFRRGIAYNLPRLNPLGGASGDPIWINPLNAPPATCEPANSSASTMKPFVCTGTSTVVTSVPGMVYANTGGSYGPMEKALNSRLDDFTGGNACDPASAPPDVNVRSYDISTPNAEPPIAPPPPPMTAWSPRNWMQPGGNTLPERQSIEINPGTDKPYDPATIQQYGALWSYSRAVQAVGASPNATAGAPFALGDWENLYGIGLAADTGGYPASPASPPFPPGTLAAPYNTDSGNYFSQPNPARPGKRNRRVLNVAIIDCAGLTPGPGLACAALPVVGVGKFFMQTKANLTGGTKTVESEFAGLLNPFPSPEVRLYK
ncbi:MAG: pilus assembly protein TadG-related protein [Polaromonas sp.]